MEPLPNPANKGYKKYGPLKTFRVEFRANIADIWPGYEPYQTIDADKIDWGWSVIRFTHKERLVIAMRIELVLSVVEVDHVKPEPNSPFLSVN